MEKVLQQNNNNIEDAAIALLELSSKQQQQQRAPLEFHKSQEVIITMNGLKSLL